MSQRERQAIGVATAPQPLAPLSLTGHERPRRVVELPSWDEAATTLDPTARQSILDLAAAGDGASWPTTSSAQAADRARALLAGQLDLAPLDPIPLEQFHDLELDPHQRLAVTLAHATPDLFLLRGHAGVGKSRVLIEVIRQALRRGQRVLIVAPTPASVDQLLAVLAQDARMLAHRCLGRDESADQLPPAVAACTVNGRARQFHEDALPAARRAAAQAAERLQQWESGEASRHELGELAQRWRQLTVELAELQWRQAHREPTDTVPGLDELLQRQQTEREDLARERIPFDPEEAALQASLATVDAGLDELRPQAEARQQNRWWTGSFWKGLIAGDVVPKVQSLAEERDRIEADLAALAQRRTELDDRERALEQRHEEQCQRLIDGVQQRRREEWAVAEEALRRELLVVTDKWRQSCQTIPVDAPRPSAPSPTAWQIFKTLSPRYLQELRQRHEAADAWVATLEAEAEGLPERLWAAVSVVAGTPTAVTQDPQFGDVSRRPFDLLIVDDAQELLEADLTRIARRAQRWVLAGRPVPLPPAERRSNPRAPSRSPRSIVTPFTRLWHLLHRDPWTREDDGRFVYHVRPVPPERRDSLEVEPVVDRPEVELRLDLPPDGMAELASVAFPPDLPPGEARQFLLRELQQLAYWPTSLPQWDEGPGLLRLHYHTPTGPVHSFELEPGVRECAEARPGDLWLTVALEFDPTTWTRDQAERWLADHRPQDAGRTVRLETPYRFSPDLASVVSPLVAAYDWITPPGDSTGRPAVLFLPVPPFADSSRNGPGRGPRRVPHGLKGAGLEIDLGEARQRSRLPNELAASLPARGIVNLAEAEATIAWLEANRPPGSLAIVALFAAQVALLQELVRRSPKLAAMAPVVGLPGDLRCAELDRVVVSLTRSHSHRAVSYGDSPCLLPEAVSRARQQLILVGDPGTLLRRADWDGPVDHHNDSASAQERAWAAVIANLITDSRVGPHLFRLAELRCS